MNLQLYANIFRQQNILCKMCFSLLTVTKTVKENIQLLQ